MAVSQAQSDGSELARPTIVPHVPRPPAGQRQDGPERCALHSAERCLPAHVLPAKNYAASVSRGYGLLLLQLGARVRRHADRLVGEGEAPGTHPFLRATIERSVRSKMMTASNHATWCMHLRRARRRRIGAQRVNSQPAPARRRTLAVSRAQRSAMPDCERGRIYGRLSPKLRTIATPLCVSMRPALARACA